MSVLLFVVGAIAAVLGIGMVGYGIPVQEFSFGNTLIVAGTTLAAGGLIVIAIGVAVRELKRITETLASGTPARRPVDMFEPRATSGIPFQSRPGTAGAPAPMPASSASDEAADVLHLMLGYERLTDPARDLEHYRRAFLKKTDPCVSVVCFRVSARLVQHAFDCVGCARRVSPAFYGRERGSDQRQQNGDDAHDDEQFKERKSSLSPVIAYQESVIG